MSVTRRQQLASHATAIIAVAMVLVACEKDDVGKSCEPKTADALPSEIVGGEEPVSEIVAVQRNGECESFQCLSHRGYPAYCTRPCTYDGDDGKGKACTVNSDCQRPLHCYDGKCRDDDCPEGFLCSEVQDVGPLAGKLFCVAREECGGNFDCEEIGEVECKKQICAGATLVDNDPAAANVLTCKERSELPFCICQDGTDDCTNEQLVCDPEGPDNTWPEGSFEQRSVCVRKED